MTSYADTRVEKYKNIISGVVLATPEAIKSAKEKLALHESVIARQLAKQLTADAAAALLASTSSSTSSSPLSPSPSASSALPPSLNQSPPPPTPSSAPQPPPLKPSPPPPPPSSAPQPPPLIPSPPPPPKTSPPPASTSAATASVATAPAPRAPKGASSIQQGPPQARRHYSQNDEKRVGDRIKLIVRQSKVSGAADFVDDLHSVKVNDRQHRTSSVLFNDFVASTSQASDSYTKSVTPLAKLALPQQSPAHNAAEKLASVKRAELEVTSCQVGLVHRNNQRIDIAATKKKQQQELEQHLIDQELLRQEQEDAVAAQVELDRKALADAEALRTKRVSRLFTRCDNMLDRVAYELKSIFHLAGLLNNPDLQYPVVASVHKSFKLAMDQWYIACDKGVRDASKWDVHQFSGFVVSFGLFFSTVVSLAAQHFGDDVNHMTQYRQSFDDVPKEVPLLLLEVLGGRGRFADLGWDYVDEFQENLLSGQLASPDVAIIPLTSFVDDTRTDTVSVSSVLVKFINALKSK